MKVITGGDRSSTYGGLFTGQVDLEMLNETASEEEPDTAFVHFREGAATNWHHHPGGQLLFLVKSRGRVGTKDTEEVILEEGHLVVAPPNEAHWHGAVPNTDCTMLAITWGTTCWHDEAPH